VPFGDAEALAGALARLAEQPELRGRLGEGGRERVRSGFNEPVVAARVLEIYDRLLQRRADELPVWDPDGDA
jgi:glycosyltransferase involved in cell wall biosynthesis